MQLDTTLLYIHRKGWMRKEKKKLSYIQNEENQKHGSASWITCSKDSEFDILYYQTGTIMNLSQVVHG